MSWWDVAGDIFDIGGLDTSGLADTASKWGGDGGGWWSSFGDIAKAALPWAQIGTAGVGMGLGIQGAMQSADAAKIAKDAAKQQGAAGKAAQAQAGPVGAFGQEQLSRATAGNIPQPVQAQIDQWAMGAKQMAQDQAARSGQGDSTMLKQWLMWIDQQAQAMKAQALQDEINSGLQAEGVAGNLYGVAGGAAGGAGAAAAGQQQGLEQLIASANQMLARLSQGAA